MSNVDCLRVYKTCPRCGKVSLRLLYGGVGNGVWECVHCDNVPTTDPYDKCLRQHETILCSNCPHTSKCLDQEAKTCNEVYRVR